MGSKFSKSKNDKEKNKETSTPVQTPVISVTSEPVTNVTPVESLVETKETVIEVIKENNKKDPLCKEEKTIEESKAEVQSKPRIDVEDTLVKDVQEQPVPDASATPTSPATRQPKKIDYVGAQTDGSKLAADLPVSVQVPEEYAHWIPVIGEHLVRNVVSQDWKLREQALNNLQRSLNSEKWISSKSPEASWSCLQELLAKSLKDKVAPLYHASLELLTLTVSAYASLVSTAAMNEGLGILIPLVLHRVGNNNLRIQESSIQVILNLLNVKGVSSQFLMGQVLSPVPGKKNTIGVLMSPQFVGRLNLVACLIDREIQGPAGKSSLSNDELFSFIKPALENPDDKVRQAAIRAIVKVYCLRKEYGEVLEPERYLGPIKPALLQILQGHFDDVKSGKYKADAVSLSADGKVGFSSTPPPSGRGPLPAAGGRLSRNASPSPMRSGIQLTPLAVMGSRPLGTPLPGPSAPASDRQSTPPPGLGKPPRLPTMGSSTLPPASSRSAVTTPSRGQASNRSIGSSMSPGDSLCASPQTQRSQPGTPGRPTILGSLPGALDADEGRPLILGSDVPVPVTPTGSVAASPFFGIPTRGTKDLKPSSRGGSRGGSRAGSFTGSYGSRPDSLSSGLQETIFDDDEEQLLDYIVSMSHPNAVVN